MNKDDNQTQQAILEHELSKGDRGAIVATVSLSYAGVDLEQGGLGFDNMYSFTLARHSSEFQRELESLMRSQNPDTKITVTTQDKDIKAQLERIYENSEDLER